MDSLTSLIPFGFETSLVERAADNLEAEKYLNETWRQIVKDFQLAGLPFSTEARPANLHELQQLVMAAMPGADRLPERANLLYRIDLPPAAVNPAFAEHDLAMAVIVREFQKVWLRLHFSQ